MRQPTDDGVRTCAFVGDRTLVVRCVDLAREQGLHVVAVASHDADILDACAGDGTELLRLDAPADLAPKLAPHRFDFLFSVAYLEIVPEAVLRQATTAVNFHDGPLPGYAGLNVTSWAIANGEETHAVTWHEMTREVDRGDIVAEATFPIDPDETALSLNARCFEAGAETFAGMVRDLAAGRLRPRPQDERPGRMLRRRDRPTVVVDPLRPAADTARAIRAIEVGDRVLNTVGSAHLVIGDESLIVGRPVVEDASGAPPGSITTDRSGVLRIATVDGDLLLGDVRRPDGTPVEAVDGQASPAAELARALDEHDPALADQEPWWREHLRGSYPELGPVEFEEAWHGQIAMTPDHLPRIYQLAPNLMTPIGYNGRGITTGTIFGQCMADLIGGMDPADLPLPITQLSTVPSAPIMSRLYQTAFTANQILKSL